MDNFTLLATLNIVLPVIVLFTFIISRSAGDFTCREWRTAAVINMAGFFLLLMQRYLPPFISIIVANYVIILGFYYQILAALALELKRKIRNRNYYLLLALSILYLALFLFFTYWRFNTTARIITVSIILFALYGYGTLIIIRNSRIEKRNTIETGELLILFAFSALFYIARAIITALGTGSVSSLFDPNIVTTITFIYLIVYNLVYLMGMFAASLRYKNSLALEEKEKLEYLFTFLNDTAKHLELEELYGKIGETLKKSIGVESIAIFLIDDDGEGHSMVFAQNDLGLPLDEVMHLKKGEGLSGAAIEKDEVIELDIHSYPNKSIVEAYSRKGVSFLAAVPLKTPDGIIGAITVVFTSTAKRQILDHSFFYYLGEQIGLVMHNARLYKRVTDMAHTDSLTGLRNRRRMMELLNHEIGRVSRGGPLFSLAIADLDHFKNVNDTYGHECGDNLLKETAHIFLEECRETDHVSRWGGEEFLFLFIHTGKAAAIEIAERIRARFEEKRCDCVGGSVITLSLGVTEYGEKLSAEELIAQADKALYRAKGNGRNRVESA